MTMQRHVRVNRHATGDTISIPAEFALSSDDVVISKDGDRLIIEPENAESPGQRGPAGMARHAGPPATGGRPGQRAARRTGAAGDHLTVFLLDTDAIPNLMQFPSGPVARAIAARRDAGIVTSLIVAAELRYGAARKASPRLQSAVEAILKLVPVVSPEPPFDVVYGDLRARLEMSGVVLAPHDLLIAAHALTLEATLVTDDQVFSRVPGLSVENWERV